MSVFDNFIVHYQDIDLVDINNIILESLQESGNDINTIETVVLSLYAQGYVIVPINEKEVTNA